MAALTALFHVLLVLVIPSLVAPLPPALLKPADPRIINGTEAKLENTRHQVSVRRKSRETIFGTGHICGGSLIAPHVVLSAAHCFWDDDEHEFNNFRKYFVVLGTLDRFVETADTLRYEIDHNVYADFDRPSFRNDLALIFLNETVPDTNPSVSVIPLNRAALPPDTMCQVTGWGIMENGDPAEVLMTVDVPIIDRASCGANYGESAIVEGMICAGYWDGRKDACQGDSGGPIVHEGKLVGVVSFGEGCAEPGFPGVYVNVSHYADWIQEAIRSGANGKSLSTAVTLVGLALIFCLK